MISSVRPMCWCFVGVLLWCSSLSASAVIASPYHQWGSVFSPSPVVRAAPAFDGPAFAPTVANLENPPTGNEVDGGGIYAFEYSVDSPEDGGHSRQESRDANGVVTGRYSISLPDGRMRTVEYVADKAGFRAKVDTNEPGTDNQAPADVQWSSSAPQQQPRPQPPQPPQPQPAVVAPIPPSEIIIVNDEQPDEPRSPHHPPRGFIPPNPSSRIHLAPPRPIRWAATPAFRLRPSAASTSWSFYPNYFPISTVRYPIEKKK